MWGSSINGLALEGEFGGVEAPAGDEPRPRVVLAMVLLLVLGLSVGLLILPVLVGIGVLMGRTVTPGLAIGSGVTALAGIKLLAFGFGLVGGVLGRPVDPSGE